MNRNSLALALILDSNLVPASIVAKTSDDDMIDSYITCACCGEKSVTSNAELNRIILASKNVEEFINLAAPSHA